MKLYMNPVSTTSRPVSLFAAEAGIPLDEIVIDLMTGEHKAPDFVAVNPNGLVPVLNDDGFVLTESSAILKYLAQKTNSPLYPDDLQERARVNEAMDWLNANFYRDFGFNYVYPQIMPHHRRRTDTGNADVVTWGYEKSCEWLSVLDRHFIGPKSDYICLGRLTIADFMGAGIVGLGEVIGFDFSPYPHIMRWLAAMKRLEHWDRVNEAFHRMVAAEAA